MSKEIDVLRAMYECFNAQDVDGVLAAVTDDVVWANAMEGGHEHGREAVRKYWSRQFAQVRVWVKPIDFTKAANNSVVAKVEQSVFGLDGKPIGEDAISLESEAVVHVFHFDGEKVSRFDVSAA